MTTRAQEVAPYARLYPLLLAEVPEIMAEWDRTTHDLPWSNLEEGERQNNLAAVVTRVIDCAMGSGSREARVDALIAAACAHGYSRREQNFEVPAIFSEYDRLRTATWRLLRELADAPTSFDAIFVIDGLLSVASRGTVLGFHRREMEELGLWDKHLTELKKTVRS
jgi:hypothetical protein